MTIKDTQDSQGAPNQSPDAGTTTTDKKPEAKQPIWMTISGALLLLLSLAMLFYGLWSNTLTPERTGVFILVLFASATIVVSRFLPKDLIESFTKTFEVLKSAVLIFIFSLLMFEEGKDFFRRIFFKELPVYVTIKVRELNAKRDLEPLNDFSIILIWEGKNEPEKDTIEHMPSDTSFSLNLGTGVTGANYFIVKDGCKFLQGDIFKPVLIDANRNLPIIAQLVCR